MFAHLDPESLKGLLDKMRDASWRMRAAVLNPAERSAGLLAEAAELARVLHHDAAHMECWSVVCLSAHMEQSLRDAVDGKWGVDAAARNALGELIDALEQLCFAIDEHFASSGLSPTRSAQLSEAVAAVIDRFRQTRQLPDDPWWMDLRRQLLHSAMPDPDDAAAGRFTSRQAQDASRDEPATDADDFRIEDPLFAALLAEADDVIDDETLEAVQGLIREELDAINQGLSDFLDSPHQLHSLHRIHRASSSVAEAARTVQREHLASLADAFAEVLRYLAEERIEFSSQDGEILLLTLEAMYDGQEGDTDAYSEEVLARIRAMLDEAKPTKAWTAAQQQADDLEAIQRAIEQELQAREKVSPELLAIFLEEAEEHIEAIYAHLERLGRDPQARDSLVRVRRSAHTLKGAAGAAELTVISQLSHRMEDLLDALYEGRLAVNYDVVQLLLSTTDVLHDLANGRIECAQIGRQVAELYRRYAQTLDAPEPAPSIASPVSFAPTSGETLDPPDTREPTLRVAVSELDALLGLASDLMISRLGLEQHLKALGRHVGQLQPSLERLRANSQDLNPRWRQSDPPTTAASEETVVFTSTDTQFMPANAEFDELEFDRYSESDLLAGSLLEAVGDVSSITEQLHVFVEEFHALLARQDKLTRDAQQRLTSMRKAPVASLATRLGRAVRSVAEQRNKHVAFDLEGGDALVDKHVLDEWADALLHLVRNAVDHGIESPEQRASAGKSETAMVRVSASLEGTHVIIKVRDDGGGLDMKRIRNTALAQGLYSADEMDAMTEQELQSLIFDPGFTTARQVDAVSGRGVGLDIVRDTARRLQADLSVESVAGRGAAFSIRLPMTLAMHRVLLVVANEQTFAIPLHAVAEVLQPGEASPTQLDEDASIRVGVARYPGVVLAQHLGVPERTETTRSARAIWDASPVLLVRSDEETVALAVDRVLASRHVVVKPLGTHLQGLRGFLGGALMGPDAVVPLLDPADFFHRDKTPSVASALGGRRPKTSTPAPRLTVMAVDDSVRMRRLLAQLIENQGWRALTAQDGVDAWEQLEGGARPDVVLLDLEMPRMDGYGLLGLLRGEPSFQHLPIIMVTSRASEKHRAKAMQLGANHYMIKPFQHDSLVQLIGECAHRTRACVPT